MIPLLGAITAELVVADPIVDVREGDVGRHVALVLAVEAREGEGDVGAGAGVVHEGVGGEGGEVGAGGGAGLVGAVGAVAVVVVEAGEGEFDGGGGDAGEG